MDDLESTTTTIPKLSAGINQASELGCLIPRLCVPGLETVGADGWEDGLASQPQQTGRRYFRIYIVPARSPACQRGSDVVRLCRH